MASFLLEIRTEEIPANALPGARRQLKDLYSKHLGEAGFTDFTTTVLSTPLRLIVTVANLPQRQADRVEELTGPPVRVAVADDGTPTKAGLGFAAKAGLPFDQLQRIETNKGEYLAASVNHVGRATSEILADITPTIISALRFPKMMRWGLGSFLFVRPVHGIVALFDDEIISFEAFGITSGRTTVGHRVHSPETIDIDHADSYTETLAKHSVMVNPNERRRDLEVAAHHLAATVGCLVHEDPHLVAEHVELVEWPGLIIGSFDRDFLDLPPEVVVSTLRHHQKCLILEFGDGTLQPHFLAVIDRKDDSKDLIRQGNEWVIRARLADAGFFFSEDRKRPLEDTISDLERVEWHRVLGSLEAKAERLGRLAVALSGQLGLDLSTELLCRAARLVKADRTTHMVGEFPELQGVMGGHYLRLEGADEALWTAVRDHYRPVGFEGDSPASALGQVLGVADRLDTIVGLFSVGEKPTGSRDPLGLRRAAQAIVKIVSDSGWTIDLEAIIGEAVSGISKQATEDLEEVKTAVNQFMADRIRRWLTDVTGVSGDTADAVMATRWVDPCETAARAEALQSVRTGDSFRALALAFKRVRNITDGKPEGEINPDLFEHKEEQELYDAVGEFHATLERLLPEHKVSEAFEAMIPIADILDRFFIEVLVMADNEDVRANRIALLKQLGRDFLNLADLSILQIDGGE
ncbi:MAG: glycine--tRNA ligase subunit beta [Acidobacteria bacterium]|nr:glycine--tRNA ligase subunit beta [Acidobacteriota bacterium]